MKINQLKSIHSWIRSSNTSEILFVTALILPLYLLLYNTMIIQINKEWQTWTLIVAILLYVGGVLWMKNSQSKEEKNLKDLQVIKNNILDKGYKFMSFEKILEIDKHFTADKVKELMFIFPNELRLAKLKGNKNGIKVLNFEMELEN